MTQESYNLGVTPNDGTGDSLRVGFIKTNNNFTELYSQISNVTSNISSLSVGANSWANQVGVAANSLTIIAFNRANDALVLATAGNTKAWDAYAIAVSGNTTAVAANLKIFTGATPPEGSVVANTGAIYVRTGGGNTAIYVKDSGVVSNTGWIRPASVNIGPSAPTKIGSAHV